MKKMVGFSPLEVEEQINPYRARFERKKALRAEREAKVQAIVDERQAMIPADEEVTCGACGEPAVRRFELTRSSIIWPEDEDEPRFNGYGNRVSCKGCEAKARETQDKMRLQHVQQILDQSGIAKTLLLKSFDNYECQTDEQSQMLEMAAAFTENHQGKWLALLGRPGTGKGHISAAIARQVLEDMTWEDLHGKKAIVKSVKYLRLIRQIRACFSNNESEERVIHEFQAPDLLIIDEIGLRSDLSSWERSVIDDLLDGRYEDEKALVITSNLTAKDLFSLLGDRVKSRFSERGEVVNFKWEDYRPRLRGKTDG